jgi:hypothetical protein
MNEQLIDVDFDAMRKHKPKQVKPIEQVMNEFQIEKRRDEDIKWIASTMYTRPVAMLRETERSCVERFACTRTFQLKQAWRRAFALFVATNSNDYRRLMNTVLFEQLRRVDRFNNLLGVRKKTSRSCNKQ